MSKPASHDLLMFFVVFLFCADLFEVSECYASPFFHRFAWVEEDSYMSGVMSLVGVNPYGHVRSDSVGWGCVPQT